jgi:hypothetical protein
LLIPSLQKSCSSTNSASGDDRTGDGSIRSPWASIAKANTLDLEPGDRVFFKGGETFSTAVNGSTLLEDPGFETGSLDAWEVDFDEEGGSTTIVRARGNSYGGLNSAGAAYRLQAWGKVGFEGDAGTVGFTFKKEGLTIAEHSREITGISYEQTLIEFAAPEDFDSAHAWVLKPLVNGVLWVDEFELVELRSVRMPN